LDAWACLDGMVEIGEVEEGGGAMGQSVRKLDEEE
jgi:hypothetical protein